ARSADRLDFRGFWGCPEPRAAQAGGGVWRSLAARFVRDEEAAGSNPATPTQVRGSFLIMRDGPPSFRASEMRHDAASTIQALCRAHREPGARTAGLWRSPHAPEAPARRRADA